MFGELGSPLSSPATKAYVSVQPPHEYWPHRGVKPPLSARARWISLPLGLNTASGPYASRMRLISLTAMSMASSQLMRSHSSMPRRWPLISLPPGCQLLRFMG